MPAIVEAATAPRPLIDLERRRAALPAAREAFGASSVPHLVVDGLLDLDAAAAHGLDDAVAALRDSDALTTFSYFNTRSRSTTGPDRLPTPVARLIDELHSDAFLAWLSEVTGVPGLVPDRALINGGVHFMGPGCFLNLHEDEHVHPTERRWRRRLNLIVYLDPGWDAAWGGHLELWDPRARAQVARIAPLYNRCVFTLIDANWHGVPEPIRCPQGRARTSLTLWYYTVEPAPVRFRPARFIARPTDSRAVRAAIALESRLFGLFHLAKRHAGVPNQVALGLMRRLRYDRVARRPEAPRRCD